MTTFATQVDQNKFLSRGGTDVSAVVTVTATDTQVNRAPSSAAELVIVDVSGSMGDPITKMIAARAATIAAIDCIGDGVPFGVIAGDNRATEVYPGGGQLAVASPQTRDLAAQAVRRLEPRGGTAIGQWLRLAKHLFGRHADARCHAILLTDGINEHETDDAFAAAIGECEGTFVCDCRGVGENWSVPELRQIASGLLGTWEYIRDPDHMASDFADTMRSSLSKNAGDVRLRVWTPQGATVRSVQQVFPFIEDMTGRREVVDERTGDYPTSPWGDEVREFHVSVSVPAREVGEESLAARVSLVVDGDALGQAKVEAIWTDEEELHTRINANVDQAAKVIELAAAVEEGMRAIDDGDAEYATARLARARVLAQETDNAEQVELLDKMIDVESDGTAKLKSYERSDALETESFSRKTGKTRRPDEP